MGAKRSAREPLYLAAFTLLSLATLLVLAFAIYFFFSTSAGMALSARVRALTGAPSAPAAAAPQPPQSLSLPEESAQPAGALENAAPPPSQPLLLAPASDEPPAPTPEPIYKVVEKRPPDGRLVIPRIWLDEALAPVAVVAGEWDLSTLSNQVGWLQTTGAHPGDDLAMVLIGHITLPPPTGGLGPFLDLNVLKPGDRVEYRTGQETYIYEVLGSSTVDPGEVESLYVADGSRLLLVTCTGYNALQRRYDERLLVEAKLVQVEGRQSEISQK